MGGHGAAPPATGWEGQVRKVLKEDWQVCVSVSTSRLAPSATCGPSTIKLFEGGGLRLTGPFKKVGQYN